MVGHVFKSIHAYVCTVLRFPFTWCLIVGCFAVGLKLARMCLVVGSKQRLVRIPEKYIETSCNFNR